jgi:hypothetical protein
LILLSSDWKSSLVCASRSKVLRTSIAKTKRSRESGSPWRRPLVWQILRPGVPFRIIACRGEEDWQPVNVAEPLELFRLKCAIDRRTTAISLTHFKRNNPLVCRVSARFNHGSAGSKQVYLARWRVHITE